MRKINRVFKTTSFKRMSSDTQSQFKIQRAKGFERRFFRAPDCILVEVLQVLWVPSRAPVLPLPWSTSYSHLPLGRNISLWKMHIIIYQFGWTQSGTRIFTQNLAYFTQIVLFYSTVQIHQSLHLIHLFGLMEQISVLHFTSFLYEPHFHSVKPYQSTSQSHLCY